MKILSVASTKGGVGKSTFVLNLAVAMLHQGRKVAILDADKQNTLSKWDKVREYVKTDGDNLNELFVASARGETLIEIAETKKKQGFFVLIDTPGVDDSNMRSALIRSDYIITTCPPSPVDLWEVESLINVIRKLQTIQVRKIPLILVFNKVPTIHTNNAIEDALNFFDTNNIVLDYIVQTTIKERIAFKHSIREGKGVIECTPSDPKACKEIKDCCDEIINYIRKS